MDNDALDIDRRNFLRTAGVGAAALGLDIAPQVLAATPASSPAANGGGAKSDAYNILFILVDQERFFRPGELPVGYTLPAHERLMKRGTTFTNHQINSCVCTPSRSVIYTGQHMQHTRMFDNTNFPWITSMSTEIPTLGDRCFSERF